MSTTAQLLCTFSLFSHASFSRLVLLIFLFASCLHCRMGPEAFECTWEGPPVRHAHGLPFYNAFSCETSELRVAVGDRLYLAEPNGAVRKRGEKSACVCLCVSVCLRAKKTRRKNTHREGERERTNERNGRRRGGDAIAKKEEIANKRCRP